MGRGPIALDSAGRFYVSTRVRTRILVFGQAGRFLGQFGTSGAGPGELREIVALAVGPRDSLFVVDRTRRLTVFDRTLRFARSNQLTVAPRSMSIQPTGTLVVEAPVLTPERAGYFVHVIDGDRIVRSLGHLADPALDARCRPCSYQRLGEDSQPNQVWISSSNRYAFALWDISGQLRESYSVPDADWFTNWDVSAGVPDGSHHVNSTILHVVPDSGSLVWINGVHAPADWTSHRLAPDGSLIAGTRGVIRGSMAALEDYLFEIDERENETVLDVIDRARSRLIASERVKGTLEMLGSGMAYRYARDPAGNTVIDVFTVRLLPR
jgi:hypothetical protein